MPPMKETIKSYVRTFCCNQDIYIDPEVEEKIDMDYICENVNSWDEKSTKNLVRSFAS